MSQLTVDTDFLRGRAKAARAGGFPKPRWIEFCETMIGLGYTVTLHEAASTVSKYVTVFNLGKRYKVRFSNHRPAKDRQQHRDCDCYVGVSHGRTVTTDEAIAETVAALGPSPFAAMADDEPCCLCKRPSVRYYADRDNMPSCGRMQCELEMQGYLDYDESVGNRG